MKTNRYTIFTDIRRNKAAYAMLIPAALYTFIFGYCTIPYMVIAFQKFSYRKGKIGRAHV